MTSTTDSLRSTALNPRPHGSSGVSQRFRDLSVTKKYVMPIIIMTMISLGIASSGFISSKNQHEILNNMYNHHMRAQRILGDVQADFGDVRRQAYQYLVADTPEKKKNFDTLIAASFEKFDKDPSAYQALWPVRKVALWSTLSKPN